MTALRRTTLGREDLRLALRGLPLGGSVELEQAAGFGRFVRMFVAMPLLGLGGLAVAAAFAAGHLMVGLLATGTTALIVAALRDDTRIMTAIERLGRGDVEEAEAGMKEVALATKRPLPQRQRARAYLVAIAWSRADHAEGLRWIQARNGAPGQRVRMPQDEWYASVATEVQLLALLGRAEEASARLAVLPPRPPGPSFEDLEAQTELLVAFARHDAEPVADRLDGWARRHAEASDERFGLVGGLLAWSFDTLGHRERADWMISSLPRAARDDLERHCPRLARWMRGFEQRRRYG